MIKYAFIKHRFYFNINGCINSKCLMMLKYGDKELFIELFLDSLNTVVENNVGLYKLEHKHTEFFKSFLSDTQGIEKIAIVGFSKEDTDYHLQPVLIQEDFFFIYRYLSIKKLHRNSLLGKSSSKLLTMTAVEISEKISNIKPKIYHLLSPISADIKINGIPLGEMAKTLKFDKK